MSSSLEGFFFKYKNIYMYVRCMNKIPLVLLNAWIKTCMRKHVFFSFLEFHFGINGGLETSINCQLSIDCFRFKLRPI